MSAKEYADQIMGILGFAGSYAELKRREAEVEKVVQEAMNEAKAEVYRESEYNAAFKRHE